MPENSKFEIVYALQGARTLKKYEVQISKFRVVKSASVFLGLAIISIVHWFHFWNIRRLEE